MANVIEKLLILQDRDRKISRVESELANIGPERAALDRRLSESQAALDAAKLKVKQIETERKKLELEADAKKQQIEKYSLQQFQTKKNDEYRALAHEIEICKEAIVKLEDQQLEFMEQAEGAQKHLSASAQAAAESKKLIEASVVALGNREIALKKQLTDLQEDHGRLEEAVEEGVRAKYERLRRQKGGSTVVGIEHGVCGGCHMRLPVQIIISCQAQQDLVTCPNCARILYYTREMDLAATD